jgi:Xaa-Pro aminopeptidase
MSLPKYLAFSLDEYRTRTQKVQAIMAQKEIDALVCLTFPNICYLTGIRTIAPYGYFMMVVPGEGEPVLLGSEFEMYNAVINCWMEESNRVCYPTGGDPLEPSKAALARLGLSRKRLGIEIDSFSLRAYDYLRLTQAMPDATWVDASGVIERVKAIKSVAEISYIRQAARLSSIGMRAAIDAAAEGVVDNDLAAAIYQATIAGGGESMSINPIVTVGPRSGVPHSTHERVRLRRGDAIFMEVGASYQRYTAPTMRTVVIGPCSETLRRMAQACIDSVNATITNIRPGRTGHEVAVEAAKPIAHFVAAGFVWHGSHAYSTGLSFSPRWDEIPDVEIRLNNPLTLQPGMVFHATTSLRNPLQCGTCFSETVVVTENGCEVLTSVPRSLVVK